jgi:hypothetical protein
MQLILSYLNRMSQPIIIQSFPRWMSENVKTYIFDLIKKETDEKQFLGTIDGTPVIHHLFYIPSQWNEAGQEKLLISAITEKKLNQESFQRVVSSLVQKIKLIPNNYKAFYQEDHKYRYDPIVESQFVKIRDLLAVTFDDLKSSLENFVRGTVLLIGQKNAGKSTIFNQLRKNRFIPVTASDEIQSDEIVYNSYCLYMIEYSGKVESFKKTKLEMQPDVIVYVLDYPSLKNSFNIIWVWLLS